MRGSQPGHIELGTLARERNRCGRWRASNSVHKGRLEPTSNMSHVFCTVGSMPRISEFYGITILMFFGDHNPPHFHVRYGGNKARVALDGTVLAGALPRRAARLVVEWAQLHGDELEDCWERAVNHEPPGTIDPCHRSLEWSTSRK